MKCAAFLGVMHEHLDGLLAPAEAEAARAHAASCAECAERLESARAFARLLADDGDVALEAWTSRAMAARVSGAVIQMPSPTPRGARRFVPFAATAAASIAASVLVVLSFARSAETTETLEEGREADLPRGRRVLAAVGREVEGEDDARVVVSPGSNGERVRIDAGTALFRVEPGRAFAVETPQGVASVLGTSFHVAVGRGNEVAVTVHAGRVKFVGAKETTTLSPGERLEVDARGVQRVIDRRKLDEAEASARRANSRAEAAVAAASEPRGPATPVVAPASVRAFLESEEGRSVLQAAIAAEKARQDDEAANAMHEAAFARFAKAAELPADQAARAKELLRQFGVAFRAAMTPPRGVSPQERNSFWKDSYTKVYDLRKHLDDDLREFLTPVQFDIYLRSYPPAPPAPADRADAISK